MAEHSFQEVMYQFDRMCKANSGCINCPLHQNNSECHIGAFVRRPEKIEQTVMQWAAENPEPVYETWFEYLLRIGVIPVIAPAGGEYQCIVESIKHKYISNDIAEKLGLEPKEAT